jgi:hypothetical protein
MGKINVVEKFRQAVLLAKITGGSPVALYYAEAATLLEHIEALEMSCKLVVGQFDAIEDDKWPTRGMQVAVESCRKRLPREENRAE